MSEVTAWVMPIMGFHPQTARRWWDYVGWLSRERASEQMNEVVSK